MSIDSVAAPTPIPLRQFHFAGPCGTKLVKSFAYTPAMPSVYIETTIPSFYFETRRDATSVHWRELTRRWWDTYRMRYDLCTSRATLVELEAAPSAKAVQARRFLEGTRVLDDLPGTAKIVEQYIKNKLMPAGPDALHLAMASMHGIDFLLTWNCRHLANALKTPHLRVVNTRLGLHIPILTTPMQLMPEDAPDESQSS